MSAIFSALLIVERMRCPHSFAAAEDIECGCEAQDVELHVVGEVTVTGDGDLDADIHAVADENGKVVRLTDPEEIQLAEEVLCHAARQAERAQYAESLPFVTGLP